MSVGAASDELFAMTIPRQYHLPLPFQESMGVEDFLVSAANAEACAWLLDRAPTDWAAPALVLWGGAGKTHLLSIWAQNYNALRVSPGDATLESLVAGAAEAKAFAVDEADAIVGYPEKEEWLQHFFNATKAAGTPLLLTAQKPPARWGLGLRDIETRLKSCPSVEILDPDDELMRGLLMKLFSDRQLHVDGGVVDYLAARLERTGAALRAAVAALDDAALERGRKISIPLAQMVLMQNQPEAEDNQNQNS